MSHLVYNKANIHSPTQDYTHVSLLGVKISTLSLKSLLVYITETIKTNQKAIITNVNIHALNTAYENARFRRFLNNSNVVFCDGFGVKLGGRLVGQSIPYRFTPPDWIDALSSVCIQNNYSVFLLGARPGVANQAATNLQKRFPMLRIAGVHHGYFNKTAGSQENELVVDMINTTKPNVLLVGFGMPMQEYWLEENWHKIVVNIGLPVGAAIDYIAGEVPRGPRLMTDYGFEWLSRLIIEPKRLWKRYLIGNPIFFWRVFTYNRSNDPLWRT